MWISLMTAGFMKWDALKNHSFLMGKGMFITLRERLCVDEVMDLWGPWVLDKLDSSMAQTVSCWSLITEGQIWLWAVLYVIWTWWQWDRLYSKSCHCCNTDGSPKQLAALLSNTFDKLSESASQLSPWITVQFFWVCCTIQEHEVEKNLRVRKKCILSEIWRVQCTFKRIFFYLCISEIDFTM